MNNGFMQSKKWISILLIVAMVFVNNGFTVLANSIADIEVEEPEAKDYFEYKVVEEVIEQKTITFVSDEEILDEENDDDTFVVEDNIEEEVEEEPAEDIKEEPEEEIVEPEQIFDEPEDIIMEEPEEDIVEEVTSDDVETDVEVEENVTIEEVVIDDIEITNVDATDDIVCLDDLSNASPSELSEDQIIAVLKKVSYKIKKINIPGYTVTQLESDEAEEVREARLASEAEIVLTDNHDKEHRLTVKLTWELLKAINVNAKSNEPGTSEKVETLRETFGVDKLIEEQQKEVEEIDNMKNLTDIVDNADVVIVSEEESSDLNDENVLNIAKGLEEKEEVEEETEEETEVEKEEIDEEVETEKEETDEKETNEVEEQNENNENVEEVIDVIKPAIKEEAHKVENAECYDLKKIYLYKVDYDALAKDIINAVNGYEEKKEDEVTLDTLNANNLILSTGVEEIDAPKGLTEEEKENVKVEIEEALKGSNITVLESFDMPAIIVEQQVLTMYKGSYSHYGSKTHTIKSTIKNLSDVEKVDCNAIVGDIAGNASWSELSPIYYAPTTAQEELEIFGDYYLSDPITISANLVVPEGKVLNICTNGQNILFDTFGSITGSGRVNICNCTEDPTIITTTDCKTYWKDSQSEVTGETYAKYHESSLISTDYVGIYGNKAKDEANIKFNDSVIVNYYNNEEDGEDVGTTGGGSLVAAEKELVALNVDFEDNTAMRTNGVALNAMNGNIIVEKCYFENNINLTNQGGAIALNTGNAVLYDCDLSKNSSYSNGGAIVGKYASGTQGVSLDKLLFDSNISGIEGGAIYFDTIKKADIGSTDVKFTNNLASFNGGAIAIGNKYGEDITNEGDINIANVLFEGNKAETCKLQVSISKDNGKRGLIIGKSWNKEISVAEKGQNYGGALYIDRSVKNVRVVNSSFDENNAAGQLLTLAGSTKVYARSFGGAIYAKGINLNIGATSFANNKGYVGATICANQVNLVYDGNSSKIEKGVANVTNMSSNPMVVPSGGAMYLMNGTNATLSNLTSDNFKENYNAIFLDNDEGTLSLKDVKATEGKFAHGDYFIGYTNYQANRMVFENVDIENQSTSLKSRDYAYIPQTGTIEKVYHRDTVIKFVGNKNVFAGNKVGSEICNIFVPTAKQVEGVKDPEASPANLRFDLTEIEYSRDTRIGLYYDIAKQVTQETTRTQAVDGDIIFADWTKANVNNYDDGYYFDDFFDLDNAYSSDFRDWRFCHDYDRAKDNLVRVANTYLTVKYVYDQENIDSINQYYYVSMAAEGVAMYLATPAQMINKDIAKVPGKTFQTFVGSGFTEDGNHFGSEYCTVKSRYTNWDFTKYQMILQDTEVKMYAVYTLDGVSARACGCPVDTECVHGCDVRGSVSDASKKAAEDFVDVNSPYALYYTYDGKRTQYMLTKDITFDSNNEGESLVGGTLLNLGGHTLTYTSNNANIKGIFVASSNNLYKYDTQKRDLVISNGIVKSTKHNAKFINTSGLSVLLNNVTFDGIKGMATTDTLIGSDKTDSSVATLSVMNTNFVNINLGAPIIDIDNTFANDKVVFDRVDMTSTQQSNILTGIKVDCDTVNVTLTNFKAKGYKIQANNDNAMLSVLGGKVKMDTNVNITGNNNRNVFLKNDTYIEPIGKLGSNFKVGITTNVDEYNFYKAWNADYIENYDFTDITASPQVHAYTPENSGLFVSDDTNKAFYKGTDGKIYVGTKNNYATLRFTEANDRDHAYVTQNIKKNTAVRLDKVLCLLNDEKWANPTDESLRWSFATGVTTNTGIGEDKDVIRIYKYIVRFVSGSQEVIGSIPDKELEYGETMTLPAAFTPVDPTATFKYWYLQDAGSEIKFSWNPGEEIVSIKKSAGDIAIFKAIWNDEYVIHYAPNTTELAETSEYDVIGRVGDTQTIKTSYPSLGKVSYYTYNTKADGTGTDYNVGQRVTGLTEDLILFCKWGSTPKVDPTPGGGGSRPSSGGGSNGGGGGGGSGSGGGGGGYNPITTYTQDNPVIPQINNLVVGFKVDQNGNIVSEQGVIVDHINTGAKVNADGSYTDAQGNRHNIDGSITNTQGVTFNIDGSIVTPDGITYYTDGSMKLPDGTIYNADGTIRTNAQQQLQQQQPANGIGPAISEFDPLTNRWKFYNQDTAGNKVYHKKTWVIATNGFGQNAWYLTDNDGYMVVGWAKFNGDWYYFSEDAQSRGEIVVGQVAIGGVNYTFNADGVLQGLPKTNVYTVVGAVNHISGVDGVWQQDTSTGKYKFIQKQNLNGAQVDRFVTGWFMVDADYYFFDENGFMKTGLIISDGKYYYLIEQGEDQGKMFTGEIILNNQKYVFDRATGACFTRTDI